MIINALATFLVTLGFGILFQVPKNRLFWVGITGMVGGVVYKYTLSLAYSESYALLLAAMSISLLAEILARKLKTPVTIFLACALIPLVPGGGLYHTMLEIVRHNFELAMSIFINTIISACAIAIGCTLVSSFLYTIFGIKRRFKSSI